MLLRSDALAPLLELSGISKSFGGVRALDDVSFELQAGEVHALVGENGAGKSTLIRIVAGAHRPDSGRLEVAGRAVEHADPLQVRSLGIAVIYQQPALFPDLSVAENIALGREGGSPWSRIDRQRRRDEARQLLSRLGSAVDPDAPVSGLRMAEQQLVEIARALGAQARILVMDEPTAALSEREAGHLLGVVRDLRASGVGIVYVSHRLEEVLALADRYSVLRDGRLVATRARGEVGREQLIRLMVGREAGLIPPRPDTRLGEPLLELRGLGCAASGVADVSLEVRAGEIVGMAGLVGAGRTELARAVFGLTPADAGEIRVAGRPVLVRTPEDARRQGIAYVPEDRRRFGVVGEMSVAANASLGVLRELARFGLVDRAAEERLAASFVSRLGIKAASVHAKLATLSGGNQQKVALARGLATKPRVLILDEPTQGIDVGAKAEVHGLMAELAAAGLGVLVISSDLPEVLGVSDRLVVMRGGRVAGSLTRAEATPEGVLALALGHREPTQPRGAGAA
jgi:rhamnose transport system ATP-binding protein